MTRVSAIQAPAADAAPPRGRGRPVGDHDARRATLLSAAISVIAQEGYAAASMRKVAEKAACTTGALTYYFANREEMVIAVIENLFDEFDTWIHPDRDPRDIRQMLQRWLEWTSARDSNHWLVLIQILVHARHEPAIAAVMHDRDGRILAAITSIFAKGQAQGLIRKDIPANILADQISAMTDGWSLMLPIEPGRFTPDRIQALVDATIAMISPPQW